VNKVYLLLGSNQGDSEHWMACAKKQIAASCGDIVRESSIYQTAAWGNTDQPDFLNQVVVIRTAMQPLELLSATQEIETALGRQRAIKWGPRTLDIDILFYNDIQANFPGLILPHPAIQDRRFTLVPLCEIDPDFMHPVLHKTMKILLELCPDDLEVKLHPNH